jgi:hypothetical protein
MSDLKGTARPGRRANHGPLMFEYMGYRVNCDRFKFRVSGDGRSVTYYATLADALENLSRLVLMKKLVDRDDQGLKDIASLRDVLEAHHREMKSVLENWGD